MYLASLVDATRGHFTRGHLARTVADWVGMMLRSLLIGFGLVGGYLIWGGGGRGGGGEGLEGGKVVKVGRTC